MKVLKLIATLMSLAIAALGVLGLVAPNVLLDFGRSLTAPPALYGVAAVRVVFGALLISVAASSRAPRALRVIGIFIVVAGLLTPFFGAEQFGGFVTWLSDRMDFLRAIALLPLLFGLLLVYAINANQRATA